MKYILISLFVMLFTSCSELAYDVMRSKDSSNCISKVDCNDKLKCNEEKEMSHDQYMRDVEIKKKYY